MPSEDWDKITVRYQDVYLNSRHEENAKGILSLIPRIKDNPAFADVVPSTSLTALCLEIPGKKAKVLIWCEKDGVEYSISLQDDLQTEEKWTKVSNKEVIPVLESYIQKISSE